VDENSVEIFSRVYLVANFLQADPIVYLRLEMMNLFVFDTGNVCCNIHILWFSPGKFGVFHMRSELKGIIPLEQIKHALR
jgi:hypothetical protein